MLRLLGAVRCRGAVDMYQCVLLPSLVLSAYQAEISDVDGSV
jgi:hypothetical protein